MLIILTTSRIAKVYVYLGTEYDMETKPITITVAELICDYRISTYYIYKHDL